MSTALNLRIGADYFVSWASTIKPQGKFNSSCWKHYRIQPNQLQGSHLFRRFIFDQLLYSLNQHLEACIERKIGIGLWSVKKLPVSTESCQFNIHLEKLSGLPRVAITAAKMIMPTGCIRSFPIGYLYMLMFFIDKCVIQSMPPAIRSSSESRVDAAIAKDPLCIVA